MAIGDISRTLSHYNSNALATTIQRITFITYNNLCSVEF